MKKISNLSGGQDSTAMTVRLLELGKQVDEIIFCDTGAEFPQMYEYIAKLDIWLQKKFDKKITILGGETYFDVIKRVKTDRSKYANRPKGITSSFLPDECTRDLKILRVGKYLKSQYPNEKIFQYVGYTFNEVRRNRGGVKDKPYFLTPLADWRWNEMEVSNYLKKWGLYNPLYNYYTRTGCYLCPKQGKKDWFILWKHFNSLFEECKKIEKWCKEYNAINTTFYYKDKNISLVELEKEFIQIDKQETYNFINDSKDISCFCK